MEGPHKKCESVEILCFHITTFINDLSRMALTSSGDVYTWKCTDALAVPTLVTELKGKRIVDIACAGEFKINAFYSSLFIIGI